MQQEQFKKCYDLDVHYELGTYGTAFCQHLTYVKQMRIVIFLFTQWVGTNGPAEVR